MRTPGTERVLIVEDDPGLGELVGDRIAQLGLAPVHARTGEDAIALLAQTPPALLLLDYSLPDMTGVRPDRQDQRARRPPSPLLSWSPVRATNASRSR